LLHFLLSYYNMHFKLHCIYFFACINVMGPMLRCD
jgi:hypothetical protein